jgi:hypothetical protein
VGSRRSRREFLADPLTGDPEVLRVQVEPDERHSEPRRGDRARADPDERVDHEARPAEAVEADAPLRELRRERGGMGAVPGPESDGRVRKEPGVSPAAPIVARTAPAPNVGFVPVGHTDRQPVERDVAVPGEVEDVLLGAVDVPGRLDRLVVTEREVGGDPGRPARRGAVDGDRLHPVEHVLEDEPARDLPRDVPGEPRVGGRAADVEEERAPLGEDPPDGVPEPPDPEEVLLSRPVVAVEGVADPQVVRGTGDDDLRAGPAEPPSEPAERVLAKKADRATPR